MWCQVDLCQYRPTSFGRSVSARLHHVLPMTHLLAPAIQHMPPYSAVHSARQRRSNPFSGRQIPLVHHHNHNTTTIIVINAHVFARLQAELASSGRGVQYLHDQGGPGQAGFRRVRATAKLRPPPPRQKQETCHSPCGAVVCRAPRLTVKRFKRQQGLQCLHQQSETTACVGALQAAPHGWAAARCTMRPWGSVPGMR